MSVIARLEVTPVRSGSMADAIASAVDAVDDYDVAYETTPTGTAIEADDPAEVFAAAAAAHDATDDDRVITELKVDHHRERDEHATERVAEVEDELGRPPIGERD